MPSLYRILPYVETVKFNGVFSQYGFRGQAVRFAQDIFEMSEKSKKFPIFAENTELVVVIERLENLNIIREFSISPDRMYRASQWLVENNPLYLNLVAHRASQQWRTKISLELSK